MDTSKNKPGKQNRPMDQDKMAEELKHDNEQAHNRDSTTGDQSEFPGYPHYPAKDDIMSAKKNERVELDVENLPKRGSNINVDLKEGMPANSGIVQNEGIPLADMDDDELVIVPGTDADVTAEDLDMLENDSGNPETLNRVKLDLIDEEDTGQEELDVPGSEIDDANESIGEEDEENNYYSLGGDGHENLEEDKS